VTRFICTGIVDQDIHPAESLVGFRINCRRPMIRGQVAVMGYHLALRNLYRLIGYTDNQYWEKLDAYKRWANLNVGNAALLREAFVKTGVRATLIPRSNVCG
jgi:hypothetical protein